MNAIRLSSIFFEKTFSNISHLLSSYMIRNYASKKKKTIGNSVFVQNNKFMLLARTLFSARDNN